MHAALAELPLRRSPSLPQSPQPSAAVFSLLCTLPCRCEGGDFSAGGAAAAPLTLPARSTICCCAPCPADCKGRDFGAGGAAAVHPGGRGAGAVQDERRGWRGSGAIHGEGCCCLLLLPLFSLLWVQDERGGRRGSGAVYSEHCLALFYCCPLLLHTVGPFMVRAAAVLVVPAAVCVASAAHGAASAGRAGGGQCGSGPVNSAAACGN